MRQLRVQRLRPFLRRDLRARLTTALLTVVVLTGLVCLGIAAATRIDTADAHHLRTQLGLERGDETCGGAGQPKCSYDDRAQAEVDREFAEEQALRVAVLDELAARAETALGLLDRVQERLAQPEAVAIADAESLRALLDDAVVDLRPAVAIPIETRRERLEWPLHARFCRDAALWRDPACAETTWMPSFGDDDLRSGLARQIAFERQMLVDARGRVETLRAREDAEPATSATLASIDRTAPTALQEALEDPEADLWHGGWTDEDASTRPILKPSERYRSPITASQRWRLVGTALFGLASLMLVVVGPVVTATTTAGEREAGTLPVLRMTGLSAGDLALAMTVGPNAFALTAAAALLGMALPILVFTADLAALGTALAAVLVASVATHLVAVGLGDALGHRVGSLIVGGSMAVGLVVPGLLGTAAVLGDVAGTGFLLGPLPVAMTQSLALSGLPAAELAAAGGSGRIGATLLTYGLVAQALLGFVCLRSWRRRVEQAWAPLFRPLEGALLALVSVGCSALAVLDLSDRIHVESHDQVNLITLFASGFLMPILGWLLVSSLVRPARASAVTVVTEVRRGFLRFQGFVVVTAVALIAAYCMVLHRTGLAAEEAEVMWTTIAQCLLVAETAVATLLLAARRREGRHRVLLLGAAVVSLQVAFTVGIYNLEVLYVAFTQTASNPIALALEASPYWLAFLVLLWAAGLGLILAALLRERDRVDQEKAESLEDAEDDEDGKPTRWLH